VKGSIGETPKAVEMFRHMSKSWQGNACSDISPIPRYTRLTRRSCRHRRSRREGGDPV